MVTLPGLLVCYGFAVDLSSASNSRSISYRFAFSSSAIIFHTLSIAYPESISSLIQGGDHHHYLTAPPGKPSLVYDEASAGEKLT